MDLRQLQPIPEEKKFTKTPLLIKQTKPSRLQRNLNSQTNITMLVLLVLLALTSAQTADCTHIPNKHGEGYYNLGKLIGLEYVVDFVSTALTLAGLPSHKDSTFSKPLFVALVSLVDMPVQEVFHFGLICNLIFPGDGGFCEWYDSGVFKFDDCLGKYLVARSLRMYPFSPGVVSNSRQATVHHQFL